MYHFKAVFFLLFIFSLFRCSAKEFDFRGSKFLVISNGDKLSSKTADYFYDHINKRIVDHTAISFVRTDASGEQGVKQIYFELVPDLDADYEILNESDRISFFAQNIKTLHWLSYMLINRFANYYDIDVSDLMPNYLDFRTGKYHYSLKYRDPHLQPNMNIDLSGVLNTHNVDNDWGIWGHNLSRVFLEDVPVTSQALIGGRREKDQFCFSAESTYDAIKDYVLDQYGKGESGGSWFMISPNDNDKVCTCDQCLKLGNSSTNASPAVISLLNKLALHYPKHFFYTTAYRTTKNAPNITLESNTGVLFSTVELSKAPRLKVSSTAGFLNNLEDWRKHSSTLYLWDYISNFDDYLTPFPVLYRFQQQLSFFKDNNIDGIFLNGSGYDYSTFDDIKTYVLSALMINHNLNIDSLVQVYTKRFYPNSGYLLNDYYLDLEKSSIDNNLDINIYTPFRKAKRSYFDVHKFNSFYKQLLQQSFKLSGDERIRVDKLLDALSFVKLQIAYHDDPVNTQMNFLEHGSTDIKNFKRRLTNAVKEGSIVNYKEEEGDLIPYLRYWSNLENAKFVSNKLSKVKVLGLQSNDYYINANILNDNKTGFLSDFNQGWFLIGEDALVQCNLSNVDRTNGITGIELKFLINERHRMLAPERIEIRSDGKLLKQFSKNDFEYDDNLVILNKELKIPIDLSLEIKIIKNKKLKNSVVACDEIHIF